MIPRRPSAAAAAMRRQADVPAAAPGARARARASAPREAAPRPGAGAPSSAEMFSFSPDARATPALRVARRPDACPAFDPLPPRPAESGFERVPSPAAPRAVPAASPVLAALAPTLPTPPRYCVRQERGGRATTFVMPRHEVAAGTPRVVGFAPA